MGPIVFVTVDCLRSDHVGCYGYDRPTTPHIDEFATSAKLYSNAYANCPGTRWAFQSLHTGLSTIRIDGLGIPEGYEPLAARCKDEGYATGGFAVNGFVSREYGYDVGFDTFYSVSDSSERSGLLKQVGKRIDKILNNEFMRTNFLLPVYEYLWSSGSSQHDRFQPAHSDTDTVDRAVEFVKQHQNDPYFLWVHLMDAHTPYGYWPEHLREVRGNTDINHTVHPGREGKVSLGQEPPQDVIDTYDAGIRSADEQIGRLLDITPDNATIVITGDHGEEFGRYRGFHNESLYSSMTHVPIIIRAPGIESGKSDVPVQHLDIPPTLLYAAGIPVPDYWEGEPLQVVDRGADFPVFFSLDSDRIGVRRGEWKYIEEDGESELYNFPHDGREVDPVDDSKMETELRKLVNDYRSSSNSMKGNRSKLVSDDDLSEDIEENLRELGYL